MRVAFVRRGRGWLLAPVFLYAAFGGLSPAAAVASWRRLVTGTVRVASDGTRYLAWQTSNTTTLTVFDSRKRRTSTYSLPESCPLADEERGTEDERGLHAAGGRFIVFCGRGTALFEVATGALRPLPKTIKGQWGVVGSRYVEGFDARHLCRQTREEKARERPCLALYDLATGAVSDRPQSQVGDLDETGAPLICPVLRGSVARSGGRNGSYGHGVFAGATEPVELIRCDGHHTFLKTFGEPRDVQLSGGLLTWDDAQPPPETFKAPREARQVVLSVYRPRTRHRRDFPLPRRPLTEVTPEAIHGIFGYSTHTSYDVFWVATETLEPSESASTPGLSAIYAARL
jgi:hypothetical protein